MLGQQYPQLGMDANEQGGLYGLLGRGWQGQQMPYMPGTGGNDPAQSFNPQTGGALPPQHQFPKSGWMTHGPIQQGPVFNAGGNLPAMQSHHQPQGYWGALYGMGRRQF